MNILVVWQPGRSRSRPDRNGIPPPIKAFRHLFLLLPPQARRHDFLAIGKHGAPVGPPALLHAGDRDDHFGVAGDEEGGVDDPILLRAHQLFPINYQDFVGRFVDQFQFRDASPRADFCDNHKPLA